MQAIGHQVVGSEDKSHEDVKLMYEKFFGGEAVNLKRALKTELGSFRTKQLLSQIFQVYYSMTKPLNECRSVEAGLSRCTFQRLKLPSYHRRHTDVALKIVSFC